MRQRSDNASRLGGLGGGRPPARVCLLVAGLLFAMAGIARAQAIPADTQLPIYFKLLTYDRTLWETPQPRLRIGLLHRLGNEASFQNLMAMIDALEASADKTINGVAFEFTTVSWNDSDELARQLAQADIDVLYVTVGHRDHLDVVAQGARARGILTLAGGGGKVGRGLSVGLSLDKDRPSLEVDLDALAAEGHQLDARVLRLCKVVKR